MIIKSKSKWFSISFFDVGRLVASDTLCDNNEMVMSFYFVNSLLIADCCLLPLDFPLVILKSHKASCLLQGG